MNNPSLIKEFNQALIELNMTKKQWINKHKISYEWLRRVVSGESQSKRIMDAILFTIEEAKKIKENRKQSKTLNMNSNDRNIEISRNIKRELSGKKQKDLAQYCGVTESHVSKWCNGHIQPSIDNLHKIAQFTDSTVEQLLNGEIKDTKRHIESTSSDKKASINAKAEIEFVMSFFELILKEALIYNYNSNQGNLKNIIDNEFRSNMEKLESKLKSLIKG